jgi:putative sterol carrier protein
MSEVIDQAVASLSERLSGGFDATVKFEIRGEGSVIVDADGVRAGDDDADCTLSADADTFQSMMAGDLNPTAAFMTGKLSVDGDMGLAMKLGAMLA